MQIASTTTPLLKKNSEKIIDLSDIQINTMPKCSFSGNTADFYIGLSARSGKDTIRIMGAVARDQVETGINKLLGQGWDDIKWPVVLDMGKQLVYHSYDAYLKGASAILGWQELQSKG
ncbi:MAG: hypothetical protein WBM83_04260 [Flavobacteriaceae bacterium]